MARDANGNYILPIGNPVVSGTTIDTGWANPTMDDIASSITNSLSRSGKGGMLVPLKHSDGTETNPAATFTTEPKSGFYRAANNDIRQAVNGVDTFRWTATAVQVWSVVGQAWYTVVTSADPVGTTTEVIALTAGQLDVVYTADINGAAFQINGEDADNGRLRQGTDYTANITTKTVTLSESYPAGTTLSAIRADITDTSVISVEGSVRNYLILLSMVEDAGLLLGMAGNVVERTSGNGGGAMWDAVLESSVTVNGANIVACTGNVTLALVLRGQEPINVSQYGTDTNIPNNKIFLDTDGVLKYKDSFGVINALY